MIILQGVAEINVFPNDESKETFILHGITKIMKTETLVPDDSGKSKKQTYYTIHVIEISEIDS